MAINITLIFYCYWS